MNGGPFFSVVIPVYNRSSTVLRTLESVRAQTFADFECIVVDDGSEDGAGLKAVVEKLNDPRFCYLRRGNGGGGAARNTGIDFARGKYIAFLDSDDLFLKDKLAQDFDSLDAVNEDVFLFSQVLVDRGSGALWIKPARGPYAGEDISEYLMCRKGWTQTSTIVVPSSLAKAVKFDERLPFGQDADFAIRTASRQVRFVMQKTPLVYFNDTTVQGRVSSYAEYLPMLAWIEEIRDKISRKAYYNYRGRQIARLASPHDKQLALGLYFDALRRGAFHPGSAIRALAQILIPRHIYRRLVDQFVAVFGKRPA